jgi:hypothetical protein
MFTTRWRETPSVSEPPEFGPEEDPTQYRKAQLNPSVGRFTALSFP